VPPPNAPSQPSSPLRKKTYPLYVLAVGRIADSSQRFRERRWNCLWANRCPHNCQTIWVSASEGSRDVTFITCALLSTSRKLKRANHQIYSTVLR
jgi:hypothetical protein